MIDRRLISQIIRANGETYASVAEKMGLTERELVTRIEDGLRLTDFERILEACGCRLGISRNGRDFVRITTPYKLREVKKDLEARLAGYNKPLELEDIDVDDGVILEQ